MKTRYIFYLLGASLIISSILVLLGVDLPKRDGTIVVNPIDYAEKNILFGMFIILITFLFTRIKNGKI